MSCCSPDPAALAVNACEILPTGASDDLEQPYVMRVNKWHSFAISCVLHSSPSEKTRAVELSTSLAYVHKQLPLFFGIITSFEIICLPLLGINGTTAVIALAVAETYDRM
jgi:hypothetical protein